MSQTKNLKKVDTFIHPSGFVEQHYRGEQTLESVLEGMKQLERCVNKAVNEQKKAALVLADVTELTKVDLSRKMLKARKKAVELMRKMNYEKAAIYGPMPVQFMVNTMAMIAGKHNKVRVFENRLEALEWLQSKK